MNGRGIDHPGDIEREDIITLLLGCKWLIGFAPRGYEDTVKPIKNVLDRCEPWVLTDALEELEFANSKCGHLDAFVANLRSLLRTPTDEELEQHSADFLAWMEDLPKSKVAHLGTNCGPSKSRPYEKD